MKDSTKKKTYHRRTRSSRSVLLIFRNQQGALQGTGAGVT